MKNFLFILFLLLILMISGCSDKQADIRIEIPKDVIITNKVVELELAKLEEDKKITEAEIKSIEAIGISVVSNVLQKYLEYRTNRNSLVKYRIILFNKDLKTGWCKIKLPDQTIEIKIEKEKGNENQESN